MDNVIEFLKLLADPTRMKIFKFLQRGEVFVCELGEVLGISQPTVSQHIRRFKHLGLVQEERRGQKVCYTLDTVVYSCLREKLAEVLDKDIAAVVGMAGEWARWQQSQELPCVRLCKGE